MKNKKIILKGLAFQELCKGIAMSVCEPIIALQNKCLSLKQNYGKHETDIESLMHVYTLCIII